MKQYGGERHPKTGWHEYLPRKQVEKRLKRRERKHAKKEIKKEIENGNY